jgi:[protein-PII] uridylyltransferase
MKKVTQHTLQDLVQKREALVASFMKGEAPDFMTRYTQIIDDYFRSSYESSHIGPTMAINKNPYAIIALGGYGRQEQCVHSDIDVMFLFKKNIPPEAEDLFREIVYPLWDIGMDIGHATRSLKECLSLAGQDFEVFMSLLDARFICGVSLLYSDLMEQLRKKIIQRKAGKIIRWLKDRNVERHAHYGDSAYLLEPNLKESHGGLRDYHTMLWIARMKMNLTQPRDLEYLGCLSHTEYEGLNDALTFIWDVRSRLHLFSQRKCDQLYFEHQQKMAASLPQKTVKGARPVEQFLGDLHGHMELIKQQYQLFLNEFGAGKRRIKLHHKISKLETAPDFEIRKGALNFKSLEAILQSPMLLFDIFVESVRLQLPLSAEARRIVKEFNYLVGEQLVGSSAVKTAFEALLRAPVVGIDVLNETLKTGLLLRCIPEFKQIVDRIEYDAYHLYPVDKHSFLTVELLKELGSRENIARDTLSQELANELTDQTLLLWAGLLHDIGKGEAVAGHDEHGAQMSAHILKKFGYSPAEIDTVAFLVRNHRLLTETATRRDINDEKIAIDCAIKIKSVDRLKMLYLLSVAYCMATGPKAWNSWNTVLLQELFFKILSTIEKGELATEAAVETVTSKKESVLAQAADDAEHQELKALLGILSPRYLLYVPETEISGHIALYRQAEAEGLAWHVGGEKESNLRTITVCAPNSPGLFSHIAGVLTLNSVEILSAQIFTWRNHYALDIFTVKAPPDKMFEHECWQRAEKQLHAAMSDELDLEQALSEKRPPHKGSRRLPLEAPAKIQIDTTSSSFYTIVEVYAYDYPGLLFDITHALFTYGLDVWVAKIATHIDQVVDVFYLKNFDGVKLDAPEELAELQELLKAVLQKKNQIQ